MYIAWLRGELGNQRSVVTVVRAAFTTLWTAAKIAILLHLGDV
jgi:hypothetical protein